MKGNKKILVIAVLLLLISVTFSTYAIYRSSATGNGSVNAANWNVSIKGTAIDSANFDFGYSDITWTTNPGKNNTIAPGATGYIEIPVVATGSEVDVLLTASITGASLPTGMTATIDGGGSQTITYNASSMTANVRINIEWTGTDEDTTEKDGTDLAAEGTALSIPVTLTAQQALS